MNTRTNDFCDKVKFTIYISDPLIWDKEELASKVVAVSCPGPWTIGNEIAPGLVLREFSSAPDRWEGESFSTDATLGDSDESNPPILEEKAMP